MNLYLGNTDKDWFDFLSKKQPDEVNFWQPGGTDTFRVLNPGEPFLFKLKSPHNAIAGGGFFVKHFILPMSVAWQVFGEKNGVETYSILHEKIMRDRGRREVVAVHLCGRFLWIFRNGGATIRTTLNRGLRNPVHLFQSGYG